MNVYFDITDDELVFTADSDTREEIAVMIDSKEYNYYQLAGDVFEYAICNGLSWVAPEDIGAMTDSLIFSDSTPHDDGVYAADANFYWFPNYQVECPIETLTQMGRVVFTKAE